MVTRRVDRLDVGSRYGGLRVCGAAAFGRRRQFPFYQLGIGATMELGRSGRPMMPHDADIGFAWSGRRRSSAAGGTGGRHAQRPDRGKSSTDMRRAPSLAQRWALRDQRNLAALTSIVN